MHRKLYLQSTVIALGLNLFVSTAQAVPPGFYLGAGFGQSDDEILNETESAYKYFAGVNLNEHIGLELAYVDLGTFANGQLIQDGISYEVIGYLPLNATVDLFGRAGFYDWEVSNGFTSRSGIEPTFGFGLNFQFNPRLSARGEYQIFTEIDGGDVEMYSASISFHF